MLRRAVSFLRRGLYWSLALFVVAHSLPGAAAQGESRRARNTQGAVPVLPQDPRADWRRIEDAASELRRQIALRPRDEALRRRLTDLAIDATFSAERALALGDAALFGAYRRQFGGQFHDTPARIGAKAGGGSRSAEYAAGVLALHGYVAPASAPTACRHFAAALAKGLPAARFRASQCLAESDPARSAALLREAAADGHPFAAELVGRACLDAKPQDLQCAWERLTQASAAGRPSAQSLLAWMYAQGTGGRLPEPERAARLYERAAKAGDAAAQNNLAELYELGRGVPADPGQAADWYRRAAEAGLPPAQFNLGRLYAAGIGVRKDSEQARKWLELAARAGVEAARTALDWLDKNAGVDGKLDQ